MGGLSPIDLQRAELDSVLASEAFRKAPNLSRLLRFICQRHWEGKAGEIKEYTLAVEALGRATDFDPFTNSIVRVELHRLREKLKSYYQDPGHGHELRIHLRSGTYIPEFLPAEAPAGSQGASQASPVAPPEPAKERDQLPAVDETGTATLPSAVAPGGTYHRLTEQARGMAVGRLWEPAPFFCCRGGAGGHGGAPDLTPPSPWRLPPRMLPVLPPALGR